MIDIIAEVLGERVEWQGMPLCQGKRLVATVGWNLPSLPTKGDVVRLRRLRGIFYVMRVEWTQDTATLTGQIGDDE